jgi:hypothetical protein
MSDSAADRLIAEDDLLNSAPAVARRGDAGRGAALLSDATAGTLRQYQA